ncbi:Gfo/Idh/MocA family oxidoreductase [bacterium]|nr:Gfo/Idh/MocA family oxidoreductase [bacterium]
MADMLSAAVIGVGHLGFHHARILSSLEGVRLAAVADLRADRAKEVGEKFGAPFFASAADIPPVDFAVVSVPTSAHSEAATALLARGSHVFIEKPIALNLADARKIDRAARNAKKLVQVGHIERFNPALFAVRDRIADPRFIEVHRLSPFPERAMDVSVALDVMIHDLDIVQLLMKGRKLKKVAAVGAKVLTDRLDIVNARLEYSGNVVANITASRVSMEAMRKIRVFQPDSYLSIDFKNRSYEWYCKKTPGTLKSLLDLDIDRQEFPDAEEPLRKELRHFVNCIRDGRPAEPGIREAVAALSLALRIEKLASKS